MHVDVARNKVQEFLCELPWRRPLHERRHVGIVVKMTPITLNDPRLTFDPIIQIEGINLMNTHESYGHAM